MKRSRLRTYKDKIEPEHEQEEVQTITKRKAFCDICKMTVIISSAHEFNQHIHEHGCLLNVDAFMRIDNMLENLSPHDFVPINKHDYIHEEGKELPLPEVERREKAQKNVKYFRRKPITKVFVVGSNDIEKIFSNRKSAEEYIESQTLGVLLKIKEYSVSD